MSLKTNKSRIDSHTFNLYKYILTGILFLILSNIKSQNCLDSTTYSGTASWYSYNGIGFCGDTIHTDSEYTVALNNTMYDASKACESCMEVSGYLGSVIVTVQELCLDCPANNMDLSKAAFLKIANLPDGTTNITWKNVACPVTGNIKYFFSNSSNPYYIDLQIRNVRYAVKKVEFKNNGSSYMEMQRQTYNSFVIIPLITPATSPFSIRVTDILGNVIEEEVPFNPGVETPGNSQFPLCVITGLANQEKQENYINVYPNPTDGKLFIEGGCLQFKLYDLTGKLILQRSNCNQLDVSSIQSGLYYYTIKTNKAIYIQKLIIK